MANRLRLTIRDEQGLARLNPNLVARLLSELEAAGEATIITLESEVPAFCQGMDLSGLAAPADAVARALERFAALLRAIGTTPRPVIALVDGPALGGGVGLAAAADVVLATPRATFALPEVLFGLIPAVVFPVLARRVGPAHARRLALGAAPLSAAEAWRLGLVDEVADDLEATLARHVQRWERSDPRALGEVKAMAAVYVDAPAHYEEHAAATFQRLLASAQTRGRISRFLAGDTPWLDGGAT